MRWWFSWPNVKDEPRRVASDCRPALARGDARASRTDPAVGSGVLLGGSAARRTGMKIETRLRGRNLPNDPGAIASRVQLTRSNHNHLGQNLQGQPVRTLPPLRHSNVAGDHRRGALTPRASNAIPAFFEAPWIINCRSGAETPNVKDEPRAERARRVRHDDSGTEVSFRKCVR